MFQVGLKLVLKLISASVCDDTEKIKENLKNKNRGGQTVSEN